MKASLLCVVPPIVDKFLITEKKLEKVKNEISSIFF